MISKYDIYTSIKNYMHEFYGSLLSIIYVTENEKIFFLSSYQYINQNVFLFILYCIYKCRNKF